jgi:S-adenosylmethionine:tRNA ribosyltransferase-isomerase
VLLGELDIEVPEALIAQTPVEPRDSCRLMYLPAEGGRRHVVFSDLPELLSAGDTLVFNDSRVLPARLSARKITGGTVELLFLRPVDTGHKSAGKGEGELWEALARPSHRLRPGHRLTLAGGEQVTLRELVGEGRWAVEGPVGHSLVAIMEAEGRLPLPPYIKSYPGEPSSYQTVYASVPGSSAAPTAGLHFTPGLLEELAKRGVGSAYVTLHIGLDTFQPIREQVVERHRIHRETYNVSAEALGAIRAACAPGRRLVAVGTTVARVLETLARDGMLADLGPPCPVSGSTDIFITPGHSFRAVDVLLTNLHLPRSTVLLLTMAFAGVERLRQAYAEAVDSGYRFFSFGDAMLIEPPAAATPDRRGQG